MAVKCGRDFWRVIGHDLENMKASIGHRFVTWFLYLPDNLRTRYVEYLGDYRGILRLFYVYISKLFWSVTLVTFADNCVGQILQFCLSLLELKHSTIALVTDLLKFEIFVKV